MRNGESMDWDKDVFNLVKIKGVKLGIFCTDGESVCTGDIVELKVDKKTKLIGWFDFCDTSLAYVFKHEYPNTKPKTRAIFLWSSISRYNDDTTICKK